MQRRTFFSTLLAPFISLVSAKPIIWNHKNIYIRPVQRCTYIKLNFIKTRSSYNFNDIIGQS